MIYLDHNATTTIHPQVLIKVNQVMSLGPINPSSIHSYGQIGKKLLEEARFYILSLLGLISNYDNGYQVIFTSGGTEANNLIISSFRNYEIFISAIEHASIYMHTRYMKNIKVIKVNEKGILDTDDLISKLKKSRPGKKIVSVMFANNETGIIQPIKEICEIAHSYGALVHSDCIQAIGKVKVNISELDIDCLSISGHKFGGPMGSGALITRTSIDLTPQIIGGGQEKSLRSGTENIPAIVGLGLASKIVKEEIENRSKYMARLQSRLEKSLLKINPTIEIVGTNTQRLPNTSLILSSDKKSEIQLVALDLNGVFVSSGSACSSGKSYPSHVLLAMGYMESKLDTAFRVSVGVDTTEKEIDKFITIYNEINE